jgi:hypothetical protein
MIFELAEKEDIDGVLSLHKKYHVDSITPEDREGGFVTTLLDKELLGELIERESGLVVAKEGERIIGFVMSASWEYCSQWPMFQHMISLLGEKEYLGQTLSTENSYQYGPVCIEKEYRGTGVLEGLFEVARKEMGKKYPILVTFVSPANPRSLKAHLHKLKMEKRGEFEYKGKSYIELLYDTSKVLG